MPSVRIVSPDWAATFAALEVWADELVAGDPAVCGVLLYGSLARGDYAPGSDADLLVVVERSSWPPRKRAERLPPLRLRAVCHQVVVYAVEELERLATAGQPFVRRALAEGRWLARREGWRPPASERSRISLSAADSGA